MSNSGHIHQYLRNQDRLSRKISKQPRKIPPFQPNNNVVTAVTNNQQPAMYNVNKCDFKQLVQQLTGFNPRESSKLEVNRPPPLPQIESTRVINGRPGSPVSPLPGFHKDLESPISAYMKYLGESMLNNGGNSFKNPNFSDQNSQYQQVQIVQEGLKEAKDPKTVSGPELPVQSDFVSSDGPQFRVEALSFADQASTCPPETTPFLNYTDKQNDYPPESFLGINTEGIYESGSSSILTVEQEKIKKQEEEELKNLEDISGSSFQDMLDKVEIILTEAGGDLAL
ncbi:hypothetical protein ACHQM5_023067 [Ranunculus cassubicifolius]